MVQQTKSLFCFPLPNVVIRTLCILYNLSMYFFSFNPAFLHSGTGALAIFLRKAFEVDITTSDYDDKEIEENIAYNCRANTLDVLPHIRRKLSVHSTQNLYICSISFSQTCPSGASRMHHLNRDNCSLMFLFNAQTHGETHFQFPDQIGTLSLQAISYSVSYLVYILVPDLLISMCGGMT